MESTGVIKLEEKRLQPLLKGYDPCFPQHSNIGELSINEECLKYLLSIDHIINIVSRSEQTCVCPWSFKNMLREFIQVLFIKARSKFYTGRLQTFTTNHSSEKGLLKDAKDVRCFMGS